METRFETPGHCEINADDDTVPTRSPPPWSRWEADVDAPGERGKVGLDPSNSCLSRLTLGVVVHEVVTLARSREAGRS